MVRLRHVRGRPAITQALRSSPACGVGDRGVHGSSPLHAPDAREGSVAPWTRPLVRDTVVRGPGAETGASMSPVPRAAADRRRRGVGPTLPILHRLSVRLSPARGTVAVLLVAASAALTPAGAQSLRGSPESVDRMYRQAQREHLQFSETASDVHAAAGSGALVPLTASNDVTLRRVAFPYVTPATKAFVAQLGRQHRAECGTPLMVTSAARPSDRQPANSVAQSVHPTGMAIDLRKPTGRCLRWLRATLLELEDAGVIEATEERRPPHFHVAVFPTSYTRYAAAHDFPSSEPTRAVTRALASVASSVAGSVAPGAVATRVTTARTTASSATVAAAKASSKASSKASQARSRRATRATTRLAAAPRSERRYRVRPGDTLWDIARAHETSVRQILSANRMAKPVIRPGQRLVLPTRVAVAVSERESVGQ